MTAEEYAAYVEQYYASYVADECVPQTSSSSSASSSSAYNNSSNEQGQGSEAERIDYDPSAIVASVFKDKVGPGHGIDVNSFVGMDGIGAGTGTDAIANPTGGVGAGSALTEDGGGGGGVSEDILRRKRFLESMLSGK